MKLLAVADKESSTLIHWIELASENLKSLDVVVSCGDLSKDYLEFLSSALGVEVIAVRGNHDPKPRWNIEGWHGRTGFYQGPVYEESFDQIHNLHGRLFFLGGWLFAGFEGSLWYNGEGPQYQEEEMARCVRWMEVRLRARQWRDKLRARRWPLIVVSHAPPYGIHDGQDVCHRGFQCFHRFLERFKPVLWLHGHTATEALAQNQQSLCAQTVVLNAYEYKFINADAPGGPAVSYKPDILAG